MNRLLSLLIILLYMVGFVFITVVLSKMIWGIMPGRKALVVVFLSWSLLGLLSGIASTLFSGLRMPIRVPLLDEDRRLRPLFEELLKSLPVKKKYVLYIEETRGWDAFAMLPNIVAVSKPLLRLLTDAELKAVMAHELGHLRSYDCLYLSFFHGVSYLPWLACLYMRRLTTAMYFLIKNIGCGPGLAVLVFISTLLVWKYHLHPAGLYIPVMALLFFLVYPPYHGFFRFLFRSAMRRQEYKQDAYAQSLGYGKELRTALLKIIAGNQVTVARYDTWFSDHPVIFERIRRLEILEGMRDKKISVN